MLHRLEIENFYSLRERQAIDLVAAQNAPDTPGRLAPLWPGAAERAPKIVALFGANASGKSNVLKALAFLAVFIRRSFHFAPDEPLAFARFHDDEMLSQPARLAMQFSGPVDFRSPVEFSPVEYSRGEASEADLRLDPDTRHCRYAYEITLDAQRVLSEALYYWPVRARRILFERDADGRVRPGKSFGLSGSDQQTLQKVLRPNASVISTLAQLSHPLPLYLFRAAVLVEGNIDALAADRIASVSGAMGRRRRETVDEATVRDYATSPGLLKQLNREIARLDIGIRAAGVWQDADNRLTTWFEHQGLAGPLPAIWESHGTRRFVEIFPILVRALEHGGIAIVDELDQAIHPLILPEIIRWFHDPERNPHNAQLWMTCQNASLLEELTKEEILFCDKDARGRTSVYSLTDIAAVRREDNYYRKYLGGVYGAVPRIG